MPTPNADLDFWRGLVVRYPRFAEEALGTAVKPAEMDYRHVRKLEAAMAKVDLRHLVREL